MLNSFASLNQICQGNTSFICGAFLWQSENKQPAMNVLRCPVEKTAVWAHCVLVSPESTLVFVQESQSQLNRTALIAAYWTTRGKILFGLGNMHWGTSHTALFKVYILAYSCLQARGLKEAWDRGCFPMFSFRFKLLAPKWVTFC